MNRLLTGFAVILVAAVWMIGSWYFFNSIGTGTQGMTTPAFADVSKSGPGDDTPGGGHGWKHGGHRGHHFLWKKLNLTDAQKKEMFSIRLDERAKMKPLIQKLKEGRDQLRALPKGQFDEAKVRSIAKAQADTLVELIVAKERMKSRIYGVLTPEQRAKAEELRKAWKERHEKKAEQKS